MSPLESIAKEQSRWYQRVFLLKAIWSCSALAQGIAATGMRLLMHAAGMKTH